MRYLHFTYRYFKNRDEERIIRSLMKGTEIEGRYLKSRANFYLLVSVILFIVTILWLR